LSEFGAESHGQTGHNFCQNLVQFSSPNSLFFFRAQTYDFKKKVTGGCHNYDMDGGGEVLAISLFPLFGQKLCAAAAGTALQRQNVR
jgi:hypothetical protein